MTLAGGNQPIRIGVPAQPMAQEDVDHIAYLVEATEKVAEAHLPMVYIPEQIDPPRICLVIAPTVDDVASLAETLGRGLSVILGAGEELLIIPLREGELLNAVRSSGTQIWPKAAE